jgi:hypothetical protein
MAIADDFSVAVNGDIRYTGTTTNYTVLELHRFLQDLADDASSSGDDLADITSGNPSSRSTDNIVTLNNGYNIDDTASEHLYDGSITQSSGDTVYSGLVVLGSVESGTNLQIIQDGALLTNYWTTGLNVDASSNIITQQLVKTRVDGVDIDGKRILVIARELGDSYAEFSVTMGLGNSVAAISTSSDLNNQTAAGTIATWTSITNTEGLRLIDITGDGSTEEYYSEWNIGTQTINETYERTKWIQRRGTSETIHGINGELFRGITHSFAYDGESGTSPATNDAYAWGLKVDYDNEASGPFTVGEAVYIAGSSAVRGRIIALDDDGATGSMILDMEAGVPANNDGIVGQTSGATADVNGTPVGQATGGGSAIFLAVDDDGTTGNIYMQITKGTAPVDDVILYKTTIVTDLLVVNGTVTQRTVSPEYIGSSTGSNIIGAYGIGFEAADVGASDTFFDLSNTQRVPPNNVTFSVGALVSGEDRVLVGPEDGAGGLDLDQLELNTTLSGAAETSVVVTTTIPSDTPSTGTIRVQDDNGNYRRLTYTSYTSATFTIDAADFSTTNATSTNNVFISYIDLLATGATESFTTVYNADRTLSIRVRDGGGTPIVPFETTGTLGTAGGSVTAIRQADV